MKLPTIHLKTWVFSLFLIPVELWACHLSAQYRYISLSGPITFLLEELNLLEDSSLKAVSLFHEVKTSKKRIGGGVFLAESQIKEWENHVVFYDESKELEKTLLNGKNLILVKLQTRGQDPFQATKTSMSILRNYLTNCTNKLVNLEKDLIDFEQTLVTQKPKLKSHYFFLGKITKDKLPSLLMLDGPILTLKKHLWVKTYESKLNYLFWSEKELETVFDKEGYYWGLNESKNKTLSIKNITERRKNLSFRGVLIPGITQIQFLKEFIKTLNKT